MGRAGVQARRRRRRIRSHWLKRASKRATGVTVARALSSNRREESSSPLAGGRQHDQFGMDRSRDPVEVAAGLKAARDAVKYMAATNSFTSNRTMDHEAEDPSTWRG